MSDLMATGDKALVLVTVKERLKIILARMDLVENEIKAVDVELRSLAMQVASAQLARPKE